MKSFLILGLGRFGASLAKTLYDLGNEVLVIDEREDAINQISNDVTHAVIGDCADENVLRALGVRNFDIAVVTIGKDLESSVLVTLMLKEMGAKYIIAKAHNPLHAKVLTKLGADRVIFPERDMGVKLAQNLTSKNILDYIEISPKYSILEITVPENWVNKSLKNINVRANHGINVMAIKSGDDIDVSPHADRLLCEDDILVVIGSNADLNKIK